MRLKYSKRTQPHSYTHAYTELDGKKSTFAYIDVEKICAWVFVFFVCRRSRQAKASHYERTKKT